VCGGRFTPDAVNRLIGVREKSLIKTVIESDGTVARANFTSSEKQ
jgi:hypothetical protein